MSIIVALDVALRADASQFEAAMKGGNASLDKFTDKANQSGKKAKDGLTSGLSGLGDVVNKATGGMGSGLSGVVGMISKTWSSLTSVVSGSLNGMSSQASKAGGKVAAGMSSSLSGVAGQAKAAGSGVSSALGGVGVAGAAAIAVVAAVVVGVALAVGKVASMVSEAVGRITELSRTATVLGTTVGAVAGLQAASASAGVGVDAMTEALLHFQRALVEATTTGGEAGIAFGKLGLQANLLKDIPIEQAFKQYANAIKATGDASDKVAISMALTGRGSAALLDVLSKGSAGIEQAMARANAIGLALTASQAASVRGISSSWAAVKQTIDGLGNSLAVVLAPAITWINELLNSLGTWLASTAKSSLPYWQVLTDTVSAFWTMLKEMGKPVMDWITGFFVSTLEYLGLWGKSWDENINVILKALFTLQFSMQNWKEMGLLAFDMMILKVAEFAATLSHFFLEAIPAILAGAEFADAMKRPLSQWEKDLQASIDKRSKAIAPALDKFIADKMNKFRNPVVDIAPPPSSISTMPTGAKLAEAGSQEAFSILAGTGQGDKMWSIANEQLQEDKKLNEKLKEMINIFKNGPVLRKAKL